MRVGVIGAGMAGLITAWLLEGTHEVVVLEKRAKIGGNARSVTVEMDGGPLFFDLGTQEISESGYPLNTRLLRLLGFGAEYLVSVPGSRTLQRSGDDEPLVVSPHAPDPGWPRATVLRAGWTVLRRFLEQAAQWDRDDLDWELPLSDLVEPIDAGPELKRDVVYALPAGLFACDLDEAETLSARAASAFFLGSDDPESAPSSEYLLGGMESLAWALGGDLNGTELHIDAGLRRMRRHEGRYELLDTTGRVHAVDAIVFALPPCEAVRALASLAGSDALRAVLNAFPYRYAIYALHRDATYMPAHRKHWSTSNAVVHHGWSETTTWYGPMHGVDLFKSQTTHRGRPPERMLARSGFEHLLPTPAVFRAQRHLARLQGNGGLYFAGHYTSGLDSQETTVSSAVEVARVLAPHSLRLALLLDS